MNKVLSIVIPVYNKYNFTKSCINDLLHLPEDHEIIVVDNGSTDETQKSLDGNKEIRYYRNQENLGFAKACNIGYSLASAPNILFLNNDIRVKDSKDSWTQKLIEHCPNALVGPTMGQLDNNLNFVQEANKVLSGKSYMSGWCLAASKEIWNKLSIDRHPGTILAVDQIQPCDGAQVFSEEFGLAYFEDVDLSFRARKLNIPFQVVEIPVVHFGKTTSKTLNVPKLYNHARNIFIKKWDKHTLK
ncbi:MAG TPA: glycosyltransferase [Nitrososphaeraceae archaeon]|nr:glycosyltransferase [Nitrososphaeraceae archaeon]